MWDFDVVRDWSSYHTPNSSGPCQDETRFDHRWSGHVPEKSPRLRNKVGDVLAHEEIGVQVGWVDFFGEILTVEASELLSRGLTSSEWHINSRVWDGGEAALEDNVAIVNLLLLASSLNAIVDYFLQH
jgi:hypothetical protein